MGQPLADIWNQDVATAPGDIPLPMVLQRAQVQRTQFRHDNLIVPTAPRPGQPVTVIATAGEDLAVTRATVFFTNDGSFPNEQSASAEMTPGETTWNILSGYVSSWQAEIPAHQARTVIRYRIGCWLATGANQESPDTWAQDGQGFWFRFAPELGITTFGFRVEEVAPVAPDWVTDGVVYHIFLDRFRSSDPHDAMPNHGPNEVHGGTFNGVARSLDYLDDLGVTSLFLSPFHPADTYHRYDTKDFFDVDPVLGSKEDLKNLTSKGAARGMRFIMDFVPSHLSWKHPAFLTAQQDRNAPTASWFTFYEWPDNYRAFLEISKALVSINTDDEGARRHLIDAALQWETEFGIDGFRLDHAIGPSMDFWTAFRVATKTARPDSFTVGEVTDTPDSMLRFRQRLDALMDFPLARALRSTFATEQWTLDQLDAFLDHYDQFFFSGPSRLSFLDNHDMDRFLFAAGQDHDRLAMAATIQFALSGTPIVYYGTEIGMTHEQPISDREAGGDSQARQDMIWDESRWNQQLHDLYRSLIAIRLRHPALRHGSRSRICADAASYVFSRTCPGDQVAAAINRSAEDRTFEFELAFDGSPDCLASTLGSSIVRQGVGWRIELPARSAALFGVPRC